MNTGTKGLKPKQRKLATTGNGKKLTGNQWQQTPQQLAFMQAWFDPTSSTYSNAYRSAVAVGYSPNYATKIISEDIGNQWIAEYRRNISFKADHVIQGIETIAKKQNIDSKSPDDTRLRALDSLAGLLGLKQASQVTVNIVQPILGGASVGTAQAQENDTIIDGTVTPETVTKP